MQNSLQLYGYAEGVVEMIETSPAVERTTGLGSKKNPGRGNWNSLHCSSVVFTKAVNLAPTMRPALLQENRVFDCGVTKDSGCLVEFKGMPG